MNIKEVFTPADALALPTRFVYDPREPVGTNMDLLERCVDWVERNRCIDKRDPEQEVGVRLALIYSFTRHVDIGYGKHALAAVLPIILGESQQEKDSKIEDLKRAIRIRARIVLAGEQRWVLNREYYPTVSKVFGIDK